MLAQLWCRTVKKTRRLLPRENKAKKFGKVTLWAPRCCSALERSWPMWRKGQPNPPTQNKYVQLSAPHHKTKGTIHVQFQLMATRNGHKSLIKGLNFETNPGKKTLEVLLNHSLVKRWETFFTQHRSAFDMLIFSKAVFISPLRATLMTRACVIFLSKWQTDGSWLTETGLQPHFTLFTPFFSPVYTLSVPLQLQQHVFHYKRVIHSKTNVYIY